MHLTPEILEAAYEYLRATPPFARWKLPPGDEVAFRVLVTRDICGQHRHDGKQHIIDVSTGRHEHTASLMITMAHEMVHLAQALRATETAGDHNREFQRLGRLVCRHHGFDSKEF